jgi:hypothetical protein
LYHVHADRYTLTGLESLECFFVEDKDIGMNNNLLTKRIGEIEQFAAFEGLTLPMSAQEIVRLEELGFVLDLRTGQILEDVDIDERLDVTVCEVKR